MEYQPMFDRVLAEPINSTNNYRGITLTNTSHIRQAKVLSIGDQVDIIKPGDTIMYEDFAGIGIEIEGRQYVVLKQIDIILKGVN